MDIRAAEISDILKKQIKNSSRRRSPEVGQVLSVGDGIARVYGLDNVQPARWSEFENGVRGHGAHLRPDNRHRHFRRISRDQEGQTVKRRAPSWTCGRQGLLGRVDRCARNPIDGKARSGQQRRRVDVKAPGIIRANPCSEPMATGSRRSMRWIPIGRGQRD